MVALVDHHPLLTRGFIAGATYDLLLGSMALFTLLWHVTR
jgi:hypothetical protein